MFIEVMCVLVCWLVFVGFFFCLFGVFCFFLLLGKPSFHKEGKEAVFLVKVTHATAAHIARLLTQTGPEVLGKQL